MPRQLNLLDYQYGYDCYWDGINLGDLVDFEKQKGQHITSETIPTQDTVTGWWDARNEIELGIEPRDLEEVL